MNVVVARVRMSRLRRVLLCALWMGACFFPLSIRAQAVILNEVVSANTLGLEDEDGDRPDWIEIFNPGAASINLNGYGLSDDPFEPMKWKFPLRLIGPREYLVVFASGKNRSSGRRLHTSFRIGSDGEQVVLTRNDGVVLDRVSVPPLQENLSYGRLLGAERWVYFDPPTPGVQNTSLFGEALLGKLQASRSSGRFEAPFELSIQTADEAAVIRFTLDGSEPKQDSPAYTLPLLVKDRSGSPDVLARIAGTSIANQHTDGWKPPRKTVRKATVIRARAFRPGALPSPEWSGTFVYGAPGAHPLPIIALALPAVELFDYDQGIYMLGKVFDDWRRLHPTEPLTGHSPANYTQRGPEWQRKAMLDWIEPNGAPGLSRLVEIDIQGQSSRSFRQKSLGVKAVSGAMDFPFLPGLVRRGEGSPLRLFHTFRLRNAGNDWAHTLFRDALCHRLVEGLPIDAQGYRPVEVFLNGEYWGIHNLREQHDPDSLALHYGIRKEGVVICNGSGTLDEGAPGSELPFLSLRDFVGKNNLSEEAHYRHVAGKMDVENFLLYQASCIYFGNADWPHNNVRVWRDGSVGLPVDLGGNSGLFPNETSTLGTWRNRGTDGRWRWLLFDCDLAFGHPWSGGTSDETLAAALSPTGRPGVGGDAGWSTAIFRGLMKNKRFERDFINTSADLMNSWFKESQALEVVDAMASGLAPHMVEHLDRWQTLSSTNAWMNQVRVLRQFASQRPVNLRQQFVRQFRLGGYSTVTVDVSNASHGKVRINRLQIDSRLVGAGPNAYPWRGWYFRGVPVVLEAQPEKGWAFERWERIGTSGIETLAVPRLEWDPIESASFKAIFAPARPRIETILQPGSTRLQLRVIGLPGGAVFLEESGELVQWNQIGKVILDDKGEAVWEWVVQPRQVRFVRARLESRPVSPL